MKYSVVVAEDEPLILDSIVRHINKADLGFEVVSTAQNGLDAWEAVEKYTPHVLFTDVQMPVMDGLELSKKMDKEYPDILKVIISGYANFEYAQQAVRYQVQDYLLKPLIHEDIVEVLKKLRTKLENQYKRIEEYLPKQEEKEYQVEEAAKLMESYINNHYMEDINLDLLANSLHFNLSYLGRVFMNQTGKSPSKYLMTVRINKAKQLLKYNHELSVQDVGILSGYPNQAYFSRIFKNVTGYTPVQVRKGEEEASRMEIDYDKKMENDSI